jgi:hypothetical protein
MIKEKQPPLSVASPATEATLTPTKDKKLRASKK